MIAKLLVASALSVFFILTPVSGQADKCAKDKLSRCTNKLLRLIREDIPIPSTVGEVQVHCEEIKNASRCSRAWFRECVDESSKQVARVIMSGVTKRFNKNCSPDGMKRIVENRDCLVSSRLPLRQCYNEAVRNLYNLKFTERKNWHSLTCCYGSRAHLCITNAVKQNCRADQVEMYLKESSQLTDELTDTFCPADLVWGKEQCANLAAYVPENKVPADQTLLPILLDIMKEVQLDPEDGPL